MAPLCYRRHRFPPEIIRHAIWLYLRFTLSYCDVEELLAERGLDISYETVRRWVLKFGPTTATAAGAPSSPERSIGIWTKWLSGSSVCGCTCGGPSTTRARSSTCWSRGAATAGRRCG